MATLYPAKTELKTSGNAYSGRKIKRMEFVYKTIDITLALNPEEYTQSEPSRVTMTQTKGGAWLDAWGSGIIEITIKGTTGVKGGTNSIDVGYQRFKDLRNLFRSVNNDAVDGAEITDAGLIKFYNFTDNEYFYCYPKQEGIELMRSKSKPNVYQYSIGLYALKAIGNVTQIQAKIGNPNKESSAQEGDLTSSSISQVTYNGGEETAGYILGINNNSHADYTTRTTIRTKANVDIVNDAKDYCDKLAELIGGIDGKISPVTGYNCCQDLSVQSTGTISNVSGFKLAETADVDNILYVGRKFTPTISVETYAMWKSIKSYSDEYLSTYYCLPSSYGVEERLSNCIASNRDYHSTLFVNATTYRKLGYIPKPDYQRIKMIMLETMMMYCSLYKLADLDDYNVELNLSFTASQIQALIDNIIALNYYLRFTASDHNLMYRQDICHDLRSIEKLLTQIKTDIVVYL